MRHLLAALLVLFAFGCSFVDPGDRQELRDRIGALPPEDEGFLRRWTVNAKAIEFLQTRKPNDQVGMLQCRVKVGGTWSGWNTQEPTYTVAHMIEVLMIQGVAVTYKDCPDYWLGRDGKAKRNEILYEKPVKGVEDYECRFVWDVRYEPEKAPPEAVDSKAISVDDIIDAMLKLPVPLPGRGFPTLIPILCPLGAGPGWGCPPDPTDPSDSPPVNPPSGQTGDQP